MKLGALAREHFDATRAVPVPFGVGAALVDEGARCGWVLVDEPPVERDPMEPDAGAAPLAPRGWLGGVVLLAVRRGLDVVHVLLDHPVPADARRAALFAPAIRVWRVEGRSLTEVAPEPFVAPDPPAVDALAFAGIIEAAGADAVVDHGALRAEVLGLEVGRVVVGEEGVPVLEVGVGRHDRLANAILYADVPVDESLQKAVAAVREHRRPGAGTHPANQLSPERWLRAVLVARPDLVGAEVLEPVEGTEPTRLRLPSPAIAAGRDASGARLVVACTTGVDVDGPAFAADARSVYGSPDTALVLALPEGDDLPAIHQLADALRPPARVVTVPRAWRELTPPA